MSSKATAASKQAMAILDDLKVGITEMVEQFKETNIPLNENASVTRVCYIVERILQIGLKDIAIFGTTTVWDYLEEIRECLPGAEKLVDRIKVLQKTDMGRVRAFIRIGLNDQMLGQSLEALVWNRELTAKYYSRESILTSEEYASMMFLLFENIKNVQFSIRVDDPLLGHMHYWDLMARPTVPLSPLKKASNPPISNSPTSKPTGSPSMAPTLPLPTSDPATTPHQIAKTEVLSASPAIVSSPPHQPPVVDATQHFTPVQTPTSPFDPQSNPSTTETLEVHPVQANEPILPQSPIQGTPITDLHLNAQSSGQSPTKEDNKNDIPETSTLSIVVEAPSSPQMSTTYMGINPALLRPESPSPMPLAFGTPSASESIAIDCSGTSKDSSNQTPGMYDSTVHTPERQRPSIGHSPVKSAFPEESVLLRSPVVEVPRVDLDSMVVDMEPKFVEEEQIERSLMRAPFETEFDLLGESPNPNYGRVLYTPPGSGRIPLSAPREAPKQSRTDVLSQGMDILGSTPSQSDLPQLFASLMLQPDVSDLHKQLLQTLRQSISQLQSHNPKEMVNLNSTLARGLLDAIEAILLDSFSQTTSWDAKYTNLWNWLSSVSPATPHVTQILSPLSRLAQLSHVSEVSRSRAFLDATINRKCLDNILSSLVKDSRLHLDPRSLLVNEALSSVFFKLIQELKQYHFDLSENPLDPLLAPPQILKALLDTHVAPSTPQSSPAETMAQSPPSNGLIQQNKAVSFPESISEETPSIDAGSVSNATKPPSFKKRKKIVTIQEAPPTPQTKKSDRATNEEQTVSPPANEVIPLAFPPSQVANSGVTSMTESQLTHPSNTSTTANSNFSVAMASEPSTGVPIAPRASNTSTTKEEAELLLNSALSDSTGSDYGVSKSSTSVAGVAAPVSAWRTVFKAAEAHSPPSHSQSKESLSRSPKGSASLKLPLSSSPQLSTASNLSSLPAGAAVIGFGASTSAGDGHSPQIGSSPFSHLGSVSTATNTAYASSSQALESGSGKRNRSFSGNAPTWAREIQQFPMGSYKPDTNWLGGYSDDDVDMQGWDDSIASSPPGMARATIGTYSAPTSVSTSPPANVPREPLPYRVLTSNIIAEYQPSTRRSVIRKESSPSNKEVDGDDDNMVLKVKQLEGEEAVAVDSQLYKNSKPAEFFILELVTKPELTSKNSNCSGCGEDLTKETARFCAYSGNFYCPNCHSNKKSILPACVIKQWSFKAAKVSDWAYTYLQSNWSRPVLDVTTLIEQAKQANERTMSLPLSLPVRLPIKIPLLPRSKHSSVTIIVTLTALRERLTTAAEFIRSCRTGQRLLSMLIDRLHLLWSSTLWSMQDLVEADSGKLEPLLKKTIEHFSRHVRHCDSCSGKGFVCEICTSREVIYPFDPQTVSCPNCKALFHEICWRSNPGKCPKCVRVRSIRGKDKPM